MADGHVAEPAGSVRWQALQLSAGCPSVRSRHPAVQHVWPGQARSHSLAQVCDFIFSQTGGVTEVPVPLESDACHFIQDGPAGRGRWAPSPGSLESSASGCPPHPCQPAYLTPAHPGLGSWGPALSLTASWLHPASRSPPSVLCGSHSGTGCPGAEGSPWAPWAPLGLPPAPPYLRLPRAV